METKLQFSSGGVVYRKRGNLTEIILLTRTEGRIFCLPKGKIEKGETLKEAALREIKEEAGINGQIEEHLGRIKYRFYSEEDRSRINKTVDFYLIKYVSGDVSDHDTDAEDVRWLPVEDALKIMTYPSERAIAKKAKDFLIRRKVNFGLR